MSGITFRTLNARKTKTGASKPYIVPVDETVGLKAGNLVRVRIKGLDKGAVAELTLRVLPPAPKTTVPRVEIPYNIGLNNGETVAIRFTPIDTTQLEAWFEDDKSKPYKGVARWSSACWSSAPSTRATAPPSGSWMRRRPPTTPRRSSGASSRPSATWSTGTACISRRTHGRTRASSWSDSRTSTTTRGSPPSSSRTGRRTRARARAPSRRRCTSARPTGARPTGGCDMSVDILSIESYATMGSVKERQSAVLLHTIEHAIHPCSADLERLTGIQRTSITARLRELEDEGRIAKMGRKKDPFSGKTVNWYGVVR